MQKMAKMTNFHCFWPMLPPGNGLLMAIELWNMYKIPFKLDTPSLYMILYLKKHNLWTKYAKNGQNDKFSLFLTYVTPWKWTFSGYRIMQQVQNGIQMR